MSSFFTTLNVVLPICLMVELGVLLRAGRILDDGCCAALNGTAFNALLPCMIFTNIYTGAAQEAGYGKLLLEKVLRDVKSAGYPSILLWVFDANLPAIRFYRSLGFTASGRKRPSFGSVEEMYTKAL